MLKHTHTKKHTYSNAWLLLTLTYAITDLVNTMGSILPHLPIWRAKRFIITHSNLTREQPYLGDGEVQTNIDDDSNKEQEEGTHHQERFLQQPHALERVVNLRKTMHHPSHWNINENFSLQTTQAYWNRFKALLQVLHISALQMPSSMRFPPQQQHPPPPQPSFPPIQLNLLNPGYINCVFLDCYRTLDVH